MEESYSLSCYPSDEQFWTDVYNSFGWKLFSSQEVINNDVDVRVVGDYIQTTKTKEHFVRLVFKRDTNMPHYSELKELEKAYNAVPDNVFKTVSKGWTVLIVFGSIILTFCAIFLFAGINNFSEYLVPIIMGLVIGPIMMTLGIVGRIRSNKKVDIQNRINYKNSEKREEIVKEAKKIQTNIKNII